MKYVSQPTPGGLLAARKSTRRARDFAGVHVCATESLQCAPRSGCRAHVHSHGGQKSPLFRVKSASSAEVAKCRLQHEMWEKGDGATVRESKQRCNERALLQRTTGEQVCRARCGINPPGHGRCARGRSLGSLRATGPCSILVHRPGGSPLVVGAGLHLDGTPRTDRAYSPRVRRTLTSGERDIHRAPGDPGARRVSAAG